MSKMIPSFYDPTTVPSTAERELFARMRDEPGTEEWTVLHSLGLAEHERQRAGEIDFLVITPLGIFALEVKGGPVRRENGLWIYGSSSENKKISPRSPFDQARSAMFSLEKRLVEAGSPLAKLVFGYGVVAPDCSLKACVSRSEAAENPGVVYDFDDRRSSLPEYIKRLATETARRYAAAEMTDRHRPTERERQELVDLLRGDFEASISARSLALDITRNVILLEEKQRRALDSFLQDERVVVLGAAGTGKTVVAVEAALRAFQDKKHVLLLTFNKNLAKYLSAKVCNEESADRLRIIGIHELMYTTLENSPFKAEISEMMSGPQRGNKVFWDEWVPDHFALVQSERPPLCDVLIVDEGQDILTDNYLNAIDTMLQGGLQDGCWLWCMDGNNQGAVYGKYSEEANKRLRQAGVAVALRENLRNTRQIAEEARKLARPKNHAEPVLEGADVTYFRVHDKKEERMRILSVLRGLLEEGVEPGQITVLSVHREPKWGFDTVASELPAAAWVTEEIALKLSERKADAITFSTISAFKGLENDFIILTEIDDLTSDWGLALAYVGMTRARAKLVVLLSPEADALRLGKST